KASSVKAYERVNDLQEAERVLIDSLAPEIRDKRILDIGVGGGRTTRYLTELSSHYTGIDYSPGMVEVARRKYGIASIYCCDARDMSRFDDGAFDYILFSFNGLDYMPHDDRVRTLREIYRLLSDRGIYMFSSHNRSGDSAKPPWKLKNRRLSLHFA